MPIIVVNFIPEKRIFGLHFIVHRLHLLFQHRHLHFFTITSNVVTNSITRVILHGNPIRGISA
jgi:hypothetical protein